MADLVVVVAPDDSFGGVLSALRDWSAAGLIDPMLWIEPRMVEHPRIAALSLEDGELSGVELGGVAGRSRFDRIRLAALVPVLEDVEGVPSDAQARALPQTVAQFLESGFGGAPVLRVRALVTRVGQRTTAPDLVAGGWHTVVLSPEDSAAPAVGRVTLRRSDDALELGTSTAAALAGVLGLWTGIPTSPFDSEPVLPGRQVRIARAFHRRLGTRAVEARLRSEVLSMDRGLPLPTRFGSASVYVDDAALASSTMSDQLWAKHAAVLRGPREPEAHTTAKPIGALEALRLFFGFLWAAVRNAPAAWATAAITRVRSAAAGSVHSLVFGSAPSSYAVVVGGVTGDGMPASWLDLAASATDLDKLVADPREVREHAARSDLGPLWQDYTAAALTLADAGERVAGLPPVQVGAQRGVLRRPAQIAPGAEDGFTGVPPHLAASTRLSTAEPYDVLGAHVLEQRLRVVAAAPATGVAASAALVDLQRWRAEHADSFAAKVGTRLGSALYATTEEIRGLLEIVRRAASAGDSLAAVQAQQRRLGLVQRVLGSVAVLALVVVGVLLGVGALALSAALVTAGSLLLAWFTAALIVFVRGQRALFALLTARRDLLAKEEVARRNLRHALRDARRLGEAYAQFLHWSRVLSRVLREPFGSGEGATAAADADVSELPRSVRLGSADVDDAVVAAAAAELRRDVFGVGWLSGCWESIVAAAPSLLGARGIELENRPLALYSEPGSGEDALLAPWVEAMTVGGIGPAVGDAQWERVLADLEDGRAHLATRLLAQVVDRRTGDGRTESFDTFMSGIERASATAVEMFEDGFLTDGARAGGAARIERSLIEQSRVGLGRVVSLVQLSRGIDEWELLAFEPGSNHSGDGQRDGVSHRPVLPPDPFGAPVVPDAVETSAHRGTAVVPPVAVDPFGAVPVPREQEH